MDLSKREKKLAREIIEKGLQREFEIGMAKFYATLEDWKTNGRNTQESYYKIFSEVTDFDKKIARRYDGVSGSRYLLIVGDILKEGLVPFEDAAGFSEEPQQYLRNVSRR